MKTVINIPENTRCLAVDDSERRLDWFLSKLPNCVTALSPDEAIKTLCLAAPFDIVFLDHDCDGKFFADPADPEFLNKSFWKVAEYLHEIKYSGQVIVHSGNPVGAERMVALLNVSVTAGSPSIVAVAIPFGMFDIKII